ncbi:Sec-independent protein translocase subunit TatA/TatB [Halorarius litoreus]|uniref:Sec-independent protein translocase subunit TatA/TatB n=1 Tax=Halorarius litoreus TaxID=2962676 RepID=UPI0020CBDFFC|nr:twin-arginine translocase TatA/TatE family subunit [Halorarius litoreus]
MLVLQMGLPGGPELLIIFVIMLLVFGVPLALVASGVVLYRRGSNDRVEELEARIEDLEWELERERRSNAGDAEDTDDND